MTEKSPKGWRAKAQSLFLRVAGRTPLDWAITATVGLIFAFTLVGVSVWGFREAGEIPPWFVLLKGREGETILAYVAAAMVLGVVVWGVTRRFGLPRYLLRVGAGLALVAMFTGGLNFFQGTRVSQATYFHEHDVYHYMLGPKYLPEVGYLDLYVCTIQALEDRIPRGQRIRNLTTYQRVTVGDYRDGKVPMPDCREQFSDERWEEFTRDLEVFFSARMGTPRGFIRDNGYNGGPFHSFFAHHLANRFEFSIENANRAAMIDVALVCLVILVVTRTFGPWYGILFALFVFTNPVDRWSINGGSFLRYMWFSSLVFGLCAAKTGRWGWAGAWLTISTALNIFPGMFLLGYLAHHGFACLRERRVTKAAWRTLRGCVAAGLCVLALSMAHTRGPANFTDYREALEPHSERVRYGYVGFGLGLRYAAGYRGQHTAEAVSEGFPHGRRVAQLEEIRWLITGLGLLGLFFTLAMATRLDAVESAALVGFVGFFGLLSTTGYYFTCACALVLLMHRKLFDSGGLALLLLLLGANVAGMFYIIQDYAHRFVLYNAVMTLSWLAWIIVAIAYFGVRTEVFARMSRLLFAPARDPRPEA
jgi:hypothetical protein